ncbi:hypothetical protein PRECH8_16540 [Insulibacter thermoxylanivorax]|uniref:Type IV pilus assembly protein PilM n=1 Tax=Insulibacter thermoxylanivorax TaxID=2749268 RepID=A0A916QG05_9BACL|nr:pilus assembly protein PilM [Insulibacter thermoxylanivorax]GFR38358.1 hypothetical protein PRECH8_16540 [Insulibacter thermoxylanivorax]
MDNHAKVVVVEYTGKKLRVQQHEMVQLEQGSVRNGRIENEEAVVSKLKEIVRDLKLQDAGVTLAVPASSAVMRRSVYPMLKDKELRNRIEVDLLAREQLPFKDPVFDYVRLGPPAVNEAAAAAEGNKSKGNNKGEEEVLIFTTPLEVVDSYARLAEEAGLEPRAVELAPLSLFRLLLLTESNLPERFMLIHAELDHADLCIFENGIPVFMRQQMMPQQYVLDSDSDRVSVYGRNLTIEISRILNYYKYSISKNQEDVQHLLISSEHDWLPTLIEQINGSFDGQVQPLMLESAIANYQAVYHSYTVPIGLAMKGA